MEDQAFVTCATNDTYALGALVLGNSLRNVQTSKKLAVIITLEVSDKIRDQLQTVFDHVELVNVLDSKDEANLALLTRPDLGVTFTKFHCWRLTRYKKCVFLDADIVVLKNCDELFNKEELSAVPDVGWPDCFNSGVFVFQPSDETYKSILQFAITHGSFDGGDQGVLNMFFSDWRTSDISKHLSFIYNMNANVTYTYLPAYKQFGKDVKIVHFLGAIKPWMQVYNSATGRVEPDSPHSLEHLQLWWDIFMKHVQPNLSQECKGLAGDLAKLHLFSPGPGRFQSSEARQHAWERGQIDYMGADAFENIERKLQTAISNNKKDTENQEAKESAKTVLASPPPPKEAAKPVAAPTSPPQEALAQATAPPPEVAKPVAVVAPTSPLPSKEASKPAIAPQPPSKEASKPAIAPQPPSKEPPKPAAVAPKEPAKAAAASAAPVKAAPKAEASAKEVEKKAAPKKEPQKKEAPKKTTPKKK